MLRWRAILVIVLTAVAVLLVGGIALLTWAVRNGLIPTSSLPAYATQTTLEGAYKLQIDRLTQLAMDADLRKYHVTNDPRDVQLFLAPEILEGKLQESPQAYRIVTDRSHNYQSRLGMLEMTPQVAQVGQPVVNRYWDTRPDGSRIEVVEYHRRVIDRSGNEIGVILVFDLQRLGAAAEERVP